MLNDFLIPVIEATNKLKIFFATCAFVAVSFLTASGQQLNEPLVCQNPTKELGTNYVLGGAFDLTKYSCLIANKPVTHAVFSPSGVTPGSESYFFNFKDGSNLAQLSNVNKMTFDSPGKYWVLQQGTLGTKKAIYCNSFEVIQTYTPETELQTCGGLYYTITFSNTAANKTFDEFVIDWGDGSKDTYAITPDKLPFVATHSFNAVPLLIPIVKGNYKRSNTVLCTTLTQNMGIAPKPKTFISSLIGINTDGTAKLTLTNETQNGAYLIQYRKKEENIWTDSPESPVFQANKAEVIIGGLTNGEEYYFRVKTKTALCSDEYLSNEVCNIHLKAQLESAISVGLSWNKNTKITSPVYDIIIKDSEGGTYTETTSDNSFSYKELACKNQYNFTVKHNYTQDSNDITVVSNQVLVNPSTSNFALAEVSSGIATVDGEDIIVQASSPLSGASIVYTFYRSEAQNTSFIEIGKSNINTFIDTTANPQEKQYCYKIQYIDACGFKSSLSPAFCSTLLLRNTPTSIAWSVIEAADPSKYRSSEKLYEVQVLDDSNNRQAVYQTDLTKISLFDIPQLKTQFFSNGFLKIGIQAIQKIETEDLNQFTLSQYSNVIKVYMPITIHVPSAFTPNGSGPSENEFFMPKGLFIDQFSMVIYNKWGNLVFKTETIEEGWDGLMNDKTTPAQPGTYAYSITGKDMFGQKFSRTGQVELMR